MHVWARPCTHIVCEPRFPLSPHISYTRDCHAALAGEDASSGCYGLWAGQLQPWIETLLKVINFAREPRLGPEISSRACRRVSPRPCHWVLFTCLYLQTMVWTHAHRRNCFRHTVLRMLRATKFIWKLNLKKGTQTTNTHTHTHLGVLIYHTTNRKTTLCACMCVCVCVKR